MTVDAEGAVAEMGASVASGVMEAFSHLLSLAISLPSSSFLVRLKSERHHNHTIIRTFVTSNSIAIIIAFSGQQGCYGRIISRGGGIDHNYLRFNGNSQVEDGQGGQDGGQEAGGGNYSHQVSLKIPLKQFPN